MPGHVLVEEDSGADDELEDVLQGLHGLQQLLCQLLSIVHIVLQDFGQLPTTRKAKTPPTDQKTRTDFSTAHLWVLRVLDSRVGQRGAEMLPYVRLQDRVEVLKLSVRDESNYEHL